jgi:hypothetical protein
MNEIVGTIMLPAVCARTVAAEAPITKIISKESDIAAILFDNCILFFSP